MVGTTRARPRPLKTHATIAWGREEERAMHDVIRAQMAHPLAMMCVRLIKGLVVVAVVVEGEEDKETEDRIPLRGEKMAWERPRQRVRTPSWEREAWREGARYR